VGATGRRKREREKEKACLTVTIPRDRIFFPLYTGFRLHLVTAPK
jgi:hypothetical protein